MPVIVPLKLALTGLLVTSVLAAQAPSPSRDLLSGARNALNDLRFEESAMLAQTVLDLPSARRAERIQAMQILASSLFPEVETAQRRDSAMAVLRGLVRIAPTADIPRELAWPGLDALLLEARTWTFGASAIPRDAESLLALDGAAVIEVSVSRPAAVTLRAIPRGGGQALTLDSTQIMTRGEVRAVIHRRTEPVLRSGNYTLVVRAVEPALSDTVEIHYAAEAEVPVLELLPVLAPFDSTTLLRESSAPKRTRGIIGGLLVAAGTMVASSVAYGGNLTPEVKRDGRATTFGLLMGIGAGAGVWFLDRGRPIPENIAANRDRLRGYADELVTRQAENDRRLLNYRARLIIDPEPLP